jgi:hypothetical protein
LNFYCGQDFASLGETVLTNVVQVNSAAPRFPDAQANVVTGLCVSGGGARAFCFTMGVYRALEDLGFITKLDAISSVSGGTWASAIFMYAKEFQGKPIDAKTLLGGPTGPKALSLDALNQNPGPMGSCATSDAFEAIGCTVCCFDRTLVRARDVWIQTVSELYLKPFGLDNNLAYMAANEAAVERIREDNPHLKNAEFVMPRDDRPKAFVMNGTLLAPHGYAASGKSAVSFQMSPDFSGCPFYPADEMVTYEPSCSLFACCHPRKHILVGGGLVETFALGGMGPAKDRELSGSDKQVKISVGKPAFPMSLVRAVGISSDAVAATIQLNALAGTSLDPSVQHWPVTSEIFPDEQRAEYHAVGDGTFSDNSGLLALLQRRASKVIWVANSYQPLSDSYDFAKVTPETFDPAKAGVVVELLDKFGYGVDSATYYHGHNQVFEKRALLSVVQKLVSLKSEGKPTVVEFTLPVQQNPWWGIKGDFSPTVVLIYLEKISEFENALPKDSQEELRKGIFGNFGNFPYY